MSNPSAAVCPSAAMHFLPQLPNKMSPVGEFLHVSTRVDFMGNRGRFHNFSQQKIYNWATLGWIIYDPRYRGGNPDRAQRWV